MKGQDVSEDVKVKFSFENNSYHHFGLFYRHSLWPPDRVGSRLWSRDSRLFIFPDCLEISPDSAWQSGKHHSHLQSLEKGSPCFPDWIAFPDCPTVGYHRDARLSNARLFPRLYPVASLAVAKVSWPWRTVNLPVAIMTSSPPYWEMYR